MKYSYCLVSFLSCAFVILLPACAAPGTSNISNETDIPNETPTQTEAPSASNFYMATDETGETSTSIYEIDGDFFVIFDVSGVKAESRFEAHWYALDIQGQDPNKPFEIVEQIYDGKSSSIFFELNRNAVWPVGGYRVEIYMEGVKVGEQQFSVQ